MKMGLAVGNVKKRVVLSALESGVVAVVKVEPQQALPESAAAAAVDRDGVLAWMQYLAVWPD
jgi:hypothetical protein